MSKTSFLGIAFLWAISFTPMSLMGQIKLQYEASESRFQKENVEESFHKGKPVYHPNQTRHLIAPSAIPLKKGTGFYQNTGFFLNAVNIGITNNISIAVGVEALTLFIALSDPGNGVLSFANIKGSIPLNRNVHIGSGFMGVRHLGSDSRDLNFALGYWMITAGNPNTHITLGVGYGKITGGWSKLPTIFLSGTAKVSRNVSLVSENWLLSYKHENSYLELNPSTGIKEPYMTSYGNHIYAFAGALRWTERKHTLQIGLIAIGNTYDNFLIYQNEKKAASGSSWVPIPIPYFDLSLPIR